MSGESCVLSGDKVAHSLYKLYLKDVCFLLNNVKKRAGTSVKAFASADAWGGAREMRPEMTSPAAIIIVLLGFCALLLLPVAALTLMLFVILVA